MAYGRTYGRTDKPKAIIKYILWKGILGLILNILTPQLLTIIIATDKSGYPHNIFLISRQKHMLWVLIRSASARHF